MVTSDVTSAIVNAKPGIQKYLALMSQVETVNVSTDALFQRAYNGFYRVQRRERSWYGAYYQAHGAVEGIEAHVCRGSRSYAPGYRTL